MCVGLSEACSFVGQTRAQLPRTQDEKLMMSRSDDTLIPADISEWDCFCSPPLIESVEGSPYLPPPPPSPLSSPPPPSTSCWVQLLRQGHNKQRSNLICDIVQSEQEPKRRLTKDSTFPHRTMTKPMMMMMMGP